MRPERAADHSPPSSAAIMEEYSYTFTHPLGHTRPVTGHFTLYIVIYNIYLQYYNVYISVRFNLKRIVPKNGRFSSFLVYVLYPCINISV